jgi:hypothetical protein
MNPTQRMLGGLTAGVLLCMVTLELLGESAIFRELLFLLGVMSGLFLICGSLYLFLETF